MAAEYIMSEGNDKIILCERGIRTVEVHPNPSQALCDGPQSLSPTEFKQLMDELIAIANAINKSITRSDNIEA